MLEEALQGKRLSKAEYEQRLPELRDRLLGVQLKLHNTAAFAQLLVITGLPTAGRSETVNRLLEWIDPKFVDVRAFGPRDEAQQQLPALYRYWASLSAKGRLGIFFGGWYQDLFECSFKPKHRHEADRAVDRICALEQLLLDNGVRLAKVHLHVSKKTLEDRLEKFAAHKLTRWRVTNEDLWYADHYRKVAKVYESCLTRTHSANAPWQVVDGTDDEHRMLEVGQLLLGQLDAGLGAAASPPASSKRKGARSGRPVPDTLPTRPPESVTEDQYKKELERLQGTLARSTRKKRFQKHSLVLAFEGMDAAGKGGAIKRITTALDARRYEVVPVSAPTPEELRYPYLWRFWRHVPTHGRIAIFDRTWYGRVLVERVRNFAAPAEWERAYEEINEFERELSESGAVVLKFWLSVSLKEQLARFQERDADPLKRFKVDPQDWENRRYYADYQVAAIDMFKRTDTKHAPWTLVEADDKHYARLKVLRTIGEELRKRG